MEKNLKLIYWGTFVVTFVSVIVLYAIFGPTTMKKGDLMSYLEQINPIVQQTAQTVASMEVVLSQPLSAQRDPAAAGLTSAKDLFASFYKQASAIKAPPAISDIHAGLVESMKNYAQGFELSEQAMKEKNNVKMQEAHALIQKGAMKLNEVSQKIMKVDAQ